MKANEMFNLLVEDCQEKSAFIGKMIYLYGSSGSIAVLKRSLDMAKVEEECLVLPVPYCRIPADNKLEIAVFVTEYLCNIQSLAHRVFKEGIETEDIGMMGSGMLKKFKKIILEELE